MTVRRLMRLCANVSGLSRYAMENPEMVYGAKALAAIELVIADMAHEERRAA